MDEQRYSRMEDMLTSLIKITGNINEQIITMKEDIRELKADVAVLKMDVAIVKEDVETLKSDFAQMRETQIRFDQELQTDRSENEKRHKEIMDKLNIIEAEQDYIWDKSARHDREILKANYSPQLC